MRIHMIGFTKKTAEEFFGLLRHAGIKRLIDIRLHNSSQLAGFTKQNDLAFFLKKICGADYTHEPLLAPTQEIMDAYKKRKGSWAEFEKAFLKLMAQRKIEKTLDGSLFRTPAVLLCSEVKAGECHRSLVLKYLDRKWGNVDGVHL